VAKERGSAATKDGDVLLVPVDASIARAAPLAALDLPLRVLVWAGADGSTWVSFHDPDWIGERHSLPPELVEALRVVGALVEAAQIA
jgi:uncharacterized protein (DUF302 family)